MAQWNAELDCYILASALGLNQTTWQLHGPLYKDGQVQICLGYNRL